MKGYDLGSINVYTLVPDEDKIQHVSCAEVKANYFWHSKFECSIIHVQV